MRSQTCHVTHDHFRLSVGSRCTRVGSRRTRGSAATYHLFHFDRTTRAAPDMITPARDAGNVGKIHERSLNACSQLDRKLLSGPSRSGRCTSYDSLFSFGRIGKGVTPVLQWATAEKEIAP